MLKEERLDKIRRAQKCVQACEIALLVLALGICAMAFILLHFNVIVSPNVYVYISIGMLGARWALRFYRWALHDTEQNILNGDYDKL